MGEWWMSLIISVAGLLHRSTATAQHPYMTATALHCGGSRKTLLLGGNCQGRSDPEGSHGCVVLAHDRCHTRSYPQNPAWPDIHGQMHRPISTPLGPRTRGTRTSMMPGANLLRWPKIWDSLQVRDEWNLVTHPNYCMCLCMYM